MPDRRPLTDAGDAGLGKATLRRRLLLAGAGLCALPLTGCGFRLRGPQALDFATVHINTPPETELGAQLRRMIATSGTTTVTETPETAAARLQILSNDRGREILSLTGAGKVREYQLTQTLRFQLLNQAGKPLSEEERKHLFGQR